MRANFHDGVAAVGGDQADRAAIGLDARRDRLRVAKVGIDFSLCWRQRTQPAT
ncbi:hypothetical protein I552_5012 [Mycobacterium xenopi 3993]|nr:hypothetical protein I552_5012 [Mycobacterium xenopi 3993]